MKATISNITEAQGVNIRQSPSATGEPVTALAAGEQVEILGKQGDWYLVGYYGTKGYIDGRYLTIMGQNGVSGVWDTIKSAARKIIGGGSGAPAQADTTETVKADANVTTPTGQTMYVATQSTSLNLRDQPGMAGRIIGKLPRGSAVTVVSPNAGGWTQVSAGGQTGHVSSIYLSLVPPATTDSVEDNAVVVNPNQNDNMISITDNVKKVLKYVAIVGGVGLAGYAIYKATGKSSASLSGYRRKKKGGSPKKPKSEVVVY